MPGNASRDTSVVIPVHDPMGEYAGFLTSLLESVCMQSVAPIEVVLSANHKIPYLEKLNQNFCDRLELVFLENSATTAPDNINFGVSRSKGEIIKLVFQDDFFINEQVLLSSQNLNEQSPWRVFASTKANHDGNLLDLHLFPSIRADLRDGINLIGPPSAVAFKKSHFIKMDNRMPYLFDIDWYLLMLHKHGLPTIETTPSIGVRHHAGQATHWAKKGKRKELRMLRSKHSPSSSFGCLCKASRHHNS
jgi:hypothetical protein